MRIVRRVLVVLLLVSGVALVADRVGVWLANRAVADQVAEELAAYRVESAPPEARITGFPFLTQLAGGRFRKVEITLRDVGHQGLRMPLVELTATGVDAPLSTVWNGEGPITAEQVVGSAVIGYGSVVDVVGHDGLELVAADGDTLRMRLPVEVLGARAVLVGRGEVLVDDDGLRLQLVDFDVEEPVRLPPAARPFVERAARSLSLRVVLPPLPYGLAVDSVHVESSGIVVTVSARDVRLAG